MKRFLILMTILLTASLLKATVCIDRYFSEKHINTYLCQNHSGYNASRTMLYKERTKRLNSFIADLITEGKLEDKKVELHIYDQALTYNYATVSKNKRAYFISCSGFVSFGELAKMIYYFAQPDWTSFEYNPEKVKDCDKTRERFRSLINKYPLPDLSKYTFKKSIVKQLAEVELVYQNDKFFYTCNGKKLKYKTNANFPVRINDRYLFVQSDSLFIYGNGKELLAFGRNPLETTEDFSAIQVYSKWINIGYSQNSYSYTYSYLENKIYKL